MATSVNGRRSPHYLLVTFPAQGHINPGLQLANRLIHHGATVTYATAVSAHRRMGEPPSVKGLSYAWFSDGFDDGLKSFEDQKIYMSELKRCGSNALSDIIRANLDGTEPITGVIYSLLVPWVSTVARGFHLPTTLLWIEPATVLDIYYYYFNASYNHLFNIDPIELPGLPPISTGDLPSFLQPSKTFPSAVVTFKEHIEALESESNPKILVNTFAELEPDALTSVERIRMIPIGPLVSSSDADDSSTGKADLFRSSEEDYIKWLDSKVDKSVIYISLGTHADDLPEKRMEALINGVLAIDRPFLWIVREKNPEEKEKKNRFLDLIREDDRGLVVDWCSQTAVLAHPSVGCFVTHCGWNSTVESLTSGVPVVAFPQFADQCTTAKLVEAMWRIGVRVKEREEGHVDGDEVRRCLEKVMGHGEEAEEMRRNAERWKKLAVDAAAEGGPSDLNVKGFVEEGMGF